MALIFLFLNLSSHSQQSPGLYRLFHSESPLSEYYVLLSYLKLSLQGLSSLNEQGRYYEYHDKKQQYVRLTAIVYTSFYCKMAKTRAGAPVPSLISIGIT